MWEPKGAAQLMDVDGGLDAAGNAVGYDFATRYPSNRAPTLALILTGRIPATPAISDMGDRTAIPPYDYPAMRVVVHDMPPIVRAAWMRGVAALPNTFAHESYIDELADRRWPSIPVAVPPALSERPARDRAAERHGRAGRVGTTHRRAHAAGRGRAAAWARRGVRAATSTARSRASAPPGPPGWRMSRWTPAAAR